MLPKDLFFNYILIKTIDGLFNNNTMRYRIYKDDGTGNLTNYGISDGNSPKHAIVLALHERVKKESHPGYWVAIPVTELTEVNQITIKP